MLSTIIHTCIDMKTFKLFLDIFIHEHPQNLQVRYNDHNFSMRKNRDYKKEKR